MDLNEMVCDGEGSLANGGGEINSQMNLIGSKRKVRENDSSSSSSSSSSFYASSIGFFNVEGHHLKINRLINLVKLQREKQNGLLASLEEKFEDFLFSESDCEDEEDKVGLDLLNVKVKADLSSIPITVDGLHLKFDWLIKFLELANKKQKRFSTCSSSIPYTMNGLDLKLDRLYQLVELEKKKHKQFCNMVSVFLKTKYEDFDMPEYEYESDDEEEEEEDVDEEQGCVID